MAFEQTGPWVREPRRLHFPVEETVPESKEHLELRTALYLILKMAFAERAAIGSDQFVYWDPTDPSACLAPDAFVRLGAPDELFDSWKVWERGAPEVAVEIVSASDCGDAVWARKHARYQRLACDAAATALLPGPDDAMLAAQAALAEAREEAARAREETARLSAEADRRIRELEAELERRR
jgi:hypothetical protein